MNITDIENPVVEGDRLELIFKKQAELISKYHGIEKKNGLLQTEEMPVNLNDRKGQARIKDFAWRVMEEVGEAMDAIIMDKDFTHYCEELIDGLHFLTELTINAGYGPGDIIPEKTPTEGMKDKLEVICSMVSLKHENGADSVTRTRTLLCTELVRNLGMTCNCLKNKPWKQSMMLTDEAQFLFNLRMTWWVYMYWLYTEMGCDGIYTVYFKKNEVNKFRQRSNY